MSKMNVEIRGLRWSKAYISLNTSIKQVFENAINGSKWDVRQITLKIDPQENKNVKIF